MCYRYRIGGLGAKGLPRPRRAEPVWASHRLAFSSSLPQRRLSLFACLPWRERPREGADSCSGNRRRGERRQRGAAGAGGSVHRVGVPACAPRTGERAVPFFFIHGHLRVPSGPSGHAADAVRVQASRGVRVPSGLSHAPPLRPLPGLWPCLPACSKSSGAQCSPPQVRGEHWGPPGPTSPLPFSVPASGSVWVFPLRSAIPAHF